jgi:hypothetical protein
MADMLEPAQVRLLGRVVGLCGVVERARACWGRLCGVVVVVHEVYQDVRQPGRMRDARMLWEVDHSVWGDAYVGCI